MPPKSTQRTSQRSSLPSSTLQTALDKLCEHLHESRRTSEEIKGTNVINPVKEALRAQRKHSEKINQSFVIKIVKELDDEDHAVCSRLDASIYSVLIQVLVESEYCRGGERAMYLLGAALYYDSHITAKKRAVDKKKTEIGGQCLQPLLEFFTDASKEHGMRQWVGLLYLLLLQGCEKNIERLGVAPEDSRRKIGKVILEEKSEIIRRICGQLITEVLAPGNIVPEYLWPVQVDKSLYTDFPAASQTGRGWNKRFQAYMDGVIEALNPDVDPAFFAQSVSTSPPHKFGPDNHTHNMVIVFDANRMLIWAGALPDAEDFDRILEVPLVIIKEIVIRTGGLPGESQLKDMGYIQLVLDNNRSAFCHLDSVGYMINQICMMQTMGDLEEMANLLCDLRPGLKVTDESRYLSQAPSSPQNDFRTLSQRSSRSDMVILNPANNEQVSAQPVDDKLSKVSNTKAIMTIEIETVEKAGSKTAFGLDGLDDSNNEQDDIDELSNDFPSKFGSKTQAQKGGLVSKKSIVTQKQLALAAKSKAKTPLWKTQKSKIGTKQTPISTEPTPTTGIQTSQLTKDRFADVTPRVSDQNIEDCFTELRRKFPFESEPRLRGAAVSSNGDYSAAFGYLIGKLRPTETQPERALQKSPTEGSTVPQINGKLNGSLHGSSSIPEPGADNSSTLNVKVAAKADPKKVAKAANTSTATAQTENRSQQLKNELAGAKKTGAKKYSLKPTPVDVYAIQADEQNKQPTKSNNAAKKGVKSTTKPPAAPKKATSKDMKSKAPAAKKRQSAPAAFQPTAAATRTQRSAAAKASQKMKGADESEDDIEDVEEQVVKNTKAQPAPKGRKNPKTTKSEERVQSEDIESVVDQMQPPPKGKKDAKTAAPQQPAKFKALQDLDDTIEPKCEAEVMKLQEEDARSLGLMNETHQDPGSEGDLYDASPKRCAPQPLPAVKNIIKPAENMFVAPKRKTKSEGSMALKLDSVLSALDDSPATNNTKFDTLPGTVESEVRSFDDVQPPTPKKKGFQAPSESEVGTLESVMEGPFVAQLITEQVMPSPVGHKSTTDKGASATTNAVEDEPEVVEETNKKKTPSPAAPPKRKEVVELSFPSKRTRLNLSDVENEEPILQGSPLRGGKKPRNRKSPRKSNGISLTPPIRRSPRLMERVKDTSTKPSDILSDMPLVDDHLARKTPVISFGNKGARNQGQSSTLRAPAKVEVDVHTEPSPDDNTRVQQNPKRKRKMVDEAENICPPKKRLSISPENVTSSHENIGHNSNAANELDAIPQNNASNLIEISDDNSDMDIQDDGSAVDDAVVQGLTSSPPSVPQTKPQFGRKVARHRASRPSSQGSRVDANGSPMAPSSPQIDRIRKIEQKLLEEQTAMSERADKDATDLPMQRSPAIFGPRLRLESLPKAKPSSPHDEAPRYVPHKTARNGSYEGVSTKEAVIPEEKLADPFIEKPERRSSGFTDRLLAEISNPDNVPDNNTLQAVQSKKTITKPAQGFSTLTNYVQRSLDGDSKIQLSEKTVAEDVVSADEGFLILNAIVKSRKRNAKSQLSKEVIADEVASAVDDVPILTELLKKSSKGGTKIQLANKTASQEEVSAVEELPVVNVIPRKSLKGDTKTQPANETAPKDVAQPLTDLSTLAAFAKKSLKDDAKTRLSKKISEIFMEDNEETLVNSDNQPPSDASPSEMTSGSSAQSSDAARSTSRDSQPSSPLTEKEDGAEAWKLAIRPHYQNLSNTAHRIVDEMIIRLAEQEDVLGLVVDQYKKNGGMVVDNALRKRREELCEIDRRLDRAKKSVFDICTEAKRMADATVQTIQQSPISSFEKQWKKDNETLLRGIEEGRRASSQ